MPYDSAGNFSLVPSYKAESGNTIRTEQHNPPLEDIANALSNVLVRDGRNGMVGPLTMGGNRISGQADGVDDTDGATVGQVALVFGSKIGSAAEKTTPVDDDYLPLYDSAASNALRRFKWSSIRTALSALFASKAITVTGSGLATGGGDLSVNRSIAVTEASQAEAQAGTASNVVMTPRRVQDAMNTRVYTGTDANNTDFPINTPLLVAIWSGAVPARNSVVPVRLSSDGSAYMNSGTGTLLDGTWCARGRGGNDGGSGDRPIYILCQRTA